MTDSLFGDVIAELKRLSGLVTDLSVDVRELRDEVRRLREVRQLPPPAAKLGTLTINQACERLRLGRSKVYQLIRRKELTVTVIDGRKRITERELERFIDRKTMPRK